MQFAFIWKAVEFDHFLPSIRRQDGDSPLHMACRGEKENIVQLLIARGANVNATSNVSFLNSFCKRKVSAEIYTI